MRPLYAACWAEFLKARRAGMFPITTLALCLAPLFGALFVVILRNPQLAAGNEALRAKATLTGFTPDWPSFFGLIAQAVGVGGLVVFGFVTAWVFGREYSDKTLKDLFTLPIRRTTTVVAKLITCLLWCMWITATTTVFGMVTGALLQLPGWDLGMFFTSMLHICTTATLTILLCPVVAFTAAVGKGYLIPLGFVILTIVTGQIIGALGFGAYYPWAIPALHSGLGSEAGGGVGPISYLLDVSAGMAGTGALIYWWNFVDESK